MTDQYGIYQIDAGIFGVCGEDGENVAPAGGFTSEEEATEYADKLNQSTDRKGSA